MAIMLAINRPSIPSGHEICVLTSFVISKIIAFIKNIPPSKITTQKAQYIRNTQGNRNGNRR